MGSPISILVSSRNFVNADLFGGARARSLSLEQLTEFGESPQEDLLHNASLPEVVLRHRFSLLIGRRRTRPFRVHTQLSIVGNFV
jgi:hypothetical protein